MFVTFSSISGLQVLEVEAVLCIELVDATVTIERGMAQLDFNLV